MAKCDVCGNNYDKTFTITQGSHTGTFDCFECAIHEMAPKCAHCHCRIIGHGVEVDSATFCCDHCARHTAKTVQTEESDKNASGDPDVLSDPALSDHIGSDWSDEGGATPAGPATANRAE